MATVTDGAWSVHFSHGQIPGDQAAHNVSAAALDGQGTRSQVANHGVAIDSMAPGVNSYAAADEVTTVPVASSIALTFSEPVARGAGVIVLKTSVAQDISSPPAASKT